MAFIQNTNNNTLVTGTSGDDTIQNGSAYYSTYDQWWCR